MLVNVETKRSSAWYEVPSIYSDGYGIAFKGLCHIDQNGVKQGKELTDIVPVDDIKAITVFQALYCTNGTVSLDGKTLRDSLVALCTMLPYGKIICVGDRDDGMDHLRIALESC